MQSVPVGISIDQVAAFVAVAEKGSLRAASEVLHISEQGVRNRLLALEQRLGVELYRKARGVRRAHPLTPQGRQFLDRANAFLEAAVGLVDVFGQSQGPRDIHVAASQYLVHYVLIDAVRKFHAASPEIRIRLSIRTERQIEEDLLSDPLLSFGVAAPYEPSPALEYSHLFSMNWSLIAPPRHPLIKRQRLGLRDLERERLILFERGSTGRQHVIDAFHAVGVSPTVEMEITNTETIVAMVAAGLGISIVPLLPSGAVTRGRRVASKELKKEIRPIRSGLLFRRGERISPAARQFADFVRQEMKT